MGQGSTDVAISRGLNNLTVQLGTALLQSAKLHSIEEISPVARLELRFHLCHTLAARRFAGRVADVLRGPLLQAP